MSRAAKATLVASILVSSLTVWGVHYFQQQEHETMYKGVLRDDERRRRKMKEREEDFLRSHQKRELYERVQRVEAVVPLSEADARGS
jgi:protein PET117